MPALRPQQRREEEGSESPEALFISALLHDGEYRPEEYRITPSHFSCWRKLHEWCEEYQHKAHAAPPLALVHSEFPDFVLGPDVSARWAAHKLHEAHASRQLRVRMREALVLLDEEDLNGAIETLQGIERPHVVRRPPIMIWDHSPEDEIEVARIATPYPTLNRVSGGIGPSELWFWAQRPGEGKTMNLTVFSAYAMEAGYRVRYLSLEMPSRTIVHRTKRALARNERKVLAQLDSKDHREIKKATEHLRHKVPGSLSVVDPSHGSVSSTTVREHMDDCDLVIVDHAGLMKTADGRRAVDDWRAMALISNSLKEDALATGIPILGAVQLNRTADTGGLTPPKLTTLAQSDALGQDADVVVTGKKTSETTRVYSAEKVREGSGARWFARYDVKTSTYSEMSKEQAQEQMAVDDDRSES